MSQRVIPPEIVPYLVFALRRMPYGEGTTQVVDWYKTALKVNAEKPALMNPRSRAFLLEKTFKHYYSPGKAATDPCRSCGLPPTDGIHK